MVVNTFKPIQLRHLEMYGIIIITTLLICTSLLLSSSGNSVLFTYTGTYIKYNKMVSVTFENFSKFNW